jgi:uncharacterized membrane protein YgdD (TMEM256/DUF423 family)
MDRFFAVCGAASAFLGVAFGAFGAHALKDRLSPDLLATFEVSVRYQMYHALALFAVAWAIGRWPSSDFSWSGWCFLSGTIVFSGSLYILSISGIRWLGAITPIGGVLFLSGWALLAWGIWKG